MINVIITGALGRMGSNIIKTLCENKDKYNVVGAIDINKELAGNDIGELIGIGTIGTKLETSENLEKVINETKPNVLIDFTAPAPCVNTVKIASSNNVNLVIGTTGFTNEQIEEIKNSISENKVSGVISQNYAIGVNIFFKTLELLAQKIGDYNIEIVEMHHKFKKDAPSGTALRAAEIIQNNLNRPSKLIYGREGLVGERTEEEICIHAIRGGDVVGDHTVIFAGDGERLELTHKASNRQAFVNGVILAVDYIADKKDGKIYNTFDVLGLNE